MASAKNKKALNCIRCGACMNTCPVYRRSGGHSYEYVIPGPIGSILGAKKEPEKHNSYHLHVLYVVLVQNVCPVKIDLDSQLYSLKTRFRKCKFNRSKEKNGNESNSDGLWVNLHCLNLLEKWQDL